MNAQETAQYQTARKELDRIYDELDAVKAEFKDLIAAMAAQLLAEETA
ncbi:MAG TPA: hypothetical protein VL426_01845 [Candidatus Binatia bacterium]|jgi:hypothetical protein|nr:hypothetical protein [Candidatus Binatia bacterium]